VSAGARFAYVQSRLQARHGRRPREADWRLLESTDDLAGYLQAARQTFFRDWIHHLAGGADAHRVERSLRQDWEGYCAEVASWLPVAWRPAVAWLSTIAYLPAIAHLAREGPAWRWMRDDPALAGVAIQDLATRRQALGDSRYRELARAISGGEEPLGAWVAQWQAIVADQAADERDRLADLATVLRRHLGTDPALVSETPAARRRQLQEAMTRRFRAWSGSAGAVFAHLGLIALDAERLRAGLVLRLLIPRSAGRPLWA
jgi:hypothetical protein